MWFAPIVILSVLALIVLYVRLLQGPVSLKVMAGPIERGISAELQGLTAKVDDAILQRGPGGEFEFQLRNLRLFEADGSVVASAPVAGVALDLAQLMMFTVAPRRVDLIEPRVSVVYSEREGLSLSFSEPVAAAPDTPLSAAPDKPTVAEVPAAPSAAVPSMLRKLDLARVISEYSARARRQQDASSNLAQVGFRNATVDIDYEGRRSSWKVAELALDLDHKRRRSVISGVARIESDRGPWTLSLLTEDSEKSGTLTLKASVRDLVPSVLGRAFPNMALLRALDLPTAANAAIRFKTTGEVTGADFAEETSRGLIDYGSAMSAPMLVDAGLYNINYDAATEKVTLAPSTVRWGDSTVTLTGGAVRETATDISSWAFNVRSVSGSLAAEEFKVAPVPLDSFAIDGRIIPATNRIEFSNIAAEAGGARVVFAGDVIAGDAASAGSRIDGQFGPGNADVVKAFWPRMMAPRARQWVGEHLVSGLLQQGTMQFRSGVFAGPDAVKGSHGVPETIVLDLNGQSVNLQPVKEGPVMTAPAIAVSMRNQVLQITSGEATIGAGGVGNVALRQVRFYVADVDAPIAEAELSFKVQSALGPALEAVRQMKLMNPDSMTVPPDKIQGKLDGDFAIRLPLLPEIEADTVAVVGRAKISDIKTKEKIGILAVQSGTVDVTFAPNEATAKGELILNGVLAKLDWRRQTPLGADPITSPLTLTANLDNADRRQLGIDVSDFIDGDTPATVAFGEPVVEGAAGSVRVIADLSPAEFSISPLAWKKPRGRPGRLEFEVVPGTVHKTELRNFKISGEAIAAEGWVGLSADQKVQEFDFPAVSLDTVSRLKINGKRGARDIVDVRASGSTFDGRNFFRSLFTSGGTASQKIANKKGGVDVTVAIDNVIGFSDTNLRDFSLKMSRRGDEMTALDARGKFEGGKALIAILQAETNGTRKIISDTTDAGQTLRLVGFYPNMQGGRGRIDVYLDGKDAEQTAGVLIIEDFKVLGDPIVSEVVSSGSGGDGPAIGASTYGQRKVVREVFEFDRMRLPFTVGYGQFAIDDSYLRGPLLGATMRGKVDYTAQKVNLGGTYIPLQGLNNALGGIPVLGQILSGPRGEGIFGITFAVQGAMANPQVVVNPLSLVAPGIFREMFQMTNPNTSVQPRAPSPANVPIDKRVRASSSGGAYEAPETVDGWSSDTVVPSKKN